MSNKRNVYSQNGEDGVTEVLLRRLQLEPGWACEFGAWDGQHLSNTFSFVELGVFTNTVMIEGEPERFKELLKLVEKFPSIIPVEAFVGTEGDNSLTSILKKTNLDPKKFNLLSIDVDGPDYEIWEALDNTVFSPAIVIIEVESGVEPDFLGRKNPINGSTPFAHMLELGKRKGYTFAGHIGNIYFIRNDLFHKTGLINLENPKEAFLRYWIKN